MCMKDVHDYLFAVHCTINSQQFVQIMGASKKGLPAISSIERAIGFITVKSTHAGIHWGNALEFLSDTLIPPFLYLGYI